MAEQGMVAGGGEPVMGVDPNGLARFLKTDPNGNLAQSSIYPSGAIPVTASASGVAAAATATLPGVAGKTTYIAGFSIDATATAAAIGNATITGPVSGTMTFLQATGATPAKQEIVRIFDPPIPASAANIPLAVASANPGAGGSVMVNAWGYQL